MSDTLFQIILTFVASVVTVLAVQRVQAKTEYKRAEAEHDREESNIDSVNIKTALQLLDRVKRENLDLSTRAASLEQLSTELGREVHKLKDDLLALSEGARKLYYQVKSLNAVPVYIPPSITGPLIS